MITRFIITNFKRFDSVTLELGNAVVLIGPNNSGKTSALQAITLWAVGVRVWEEKRTGSSASKRTGVTINRKDLYPIPIPSAQLLWSNLHTQDSRTENGKQKTEKVYITLTAEGIHEGNPWTCSMEFYYANTESLYCRLKNSLDGKVPIGALQHAIVFLPPMSGLSEREHKKETGEISLLIGEGRTAEVLRNLCWQLWSQNPDAWKVLVERIHRLFGILLRNPIYVKERAELSLGYLEPSGIELDISSSGRGCQQVLLLLSYLLANPGAILLLDEPDAHLEIIRQRDIYNLITSIANDQNSQIIAASHSEIILQEAAERDVVMAFVGKPHRIDTRSRHQVKKALESIRMADYYIAEQKGWMLYLEGSTDLAILRSLASRLGHPAAKVLQDSVPAIYLGNNQPQEARNHYNGLREAKPDLVGIALFDRLDKELQSGSQLREFMWSRREIENYLVTPTSLRTYVQIGLRNDNLFDDVERKKRITVLDSCIDKLVEALRTINKSDPWGPDIKVTDDFLDPLFKRYYEHIGTPQKTFKRDYHELALSIPLEEIDGEISAKLDAILETAQRASPAP